MIILKRILSFPLRILLRKYFSSSLDSSLKSSHFRLEFTCLFTLKFLLGHRYNLVSESLIVLLEGEYQLVDLRLVVAILCADVLLQYASMDRPICFDEHSFEEGDKSHVLRRGSSNLWWTNCKARRDLTASRYQYPRRQTCPLIQLYLQRLI